ncbi:hypothetical protein Dda_8962 [Drechslerella dactyloides]|uniref:DDE-1 domain-containing protein n=1 Tax=Drechslerella dactyloides TaxID=74499 RepID=A0AAD6IPY0_DREDA|nr:hypothetical protein Dda_8962 [Drechslerella dactyloides]
MPCGGSYDDGCGDPDLIQKWFQLIQAIKAKYGIADNDIYNFDETGFAMGIISTTTVVTGAEMRDKAKLAQPGNREWATVIQGIGAEGWAVPPFIVLAGQHHLASWYTETNLPNDWAITLSDNGWTTNEVAVEWLKHFNQFTARRCISDYRLLVLDGHKSHHSAAFELYCQEHKIITVCMPPHSSHLLQPLDIGCFGPLKQAYSCQVEDLMRAHVNHISKLEFLSGFHRAFTAAITPKNIRSSFAGAGIVPYDPDRVLLKLDVQLPASTPINSRPSTANAATTWTTKTPMNPSEAGLQSELIKNQIIQHQDSSPTSLLAAVDQFTKGTQTIMHQLALIRAENTTLRTANEVLSKRRQAKRRRIQHGGTLTIHQAGEILDDNAVAQRNGSVAVKPVFLLGWGVEVFRSLFLMNDMICLTEGVWLARQTTGANASVSRCQTLGGRHDDRTQLPSPDSAPNNWRAVARGEHLLRNYLNEKDRG